jgi:hypothetical protein
MRRILVACAAVCATAALAVPAALADSPHFVQGPTTSVSVNGATADLNLSFKAAGLGNATAYVTWNLTASGTIFSRCYNHGGNKPQADNKQENVSINTTFDTAVNHGNTTFNGTAATVTSTLTCPGNQIVKIETVDVSGTLSLVGGDLSADLHWVYP